MAAAPAPAPVPRDANGLPAWEALIAQAGLRGPLGLLAQNAVLRERDGQTLVLALQPVHMHLAVEPMVSVSLAPFRKPVKSSRICAIDSLTAELASMAVMPALPVPNTADPHPGGGAGFPHHRPGVAAE